MQLNQLPGQWRHTLIENSALWNRSVYDLSSLDLKIFLRQHWQTPVYTRALTEVTDLTNIVWESVINGALTDAPRIVYFEVPTPRLTIDELLSWLSEVSIERRKAILFALETGCSIRETVELEHGDLSTKRLTPFAANIVRSMARHLQLDYIFWETTETNKAMPLVGLEESVIDVSQGMGFDGLRRLYQDMIVIDRADDLARFKSTVVQ